MTSEGRQEASVLNADSSSSVKFGCRSSNQRSASFLKGTGGIVFTDPDASIMTNLILTCSSLRSITNRGYTKITQLQPNYDMDCLEKKWVEVVRKRLRKSTAKSG